jgi:hypothetical protein
VSAPARGDRVRCTLGDSVLVGTYRSRPDRPGSHSVLVDGATVLVDGADCANRLFGGWTVEVLSEPEPPVGTVVLDQEGDAWQLTKHGWRCIYSDESAFATLDDLDRDWGPLTLLEVAR